MGRLILFLILLICSVWLGVTVMQHPGYLLLVYQPWMVQTPLWFALLTLILAFLLFYILIDSIDQLHLMWFKFKNWLQFRREHKSYSKTQLGLAALIEERWKKSERLLLSGLKQTVEPLMNYLGAAKAAHQQKAYDRRDQYIRSAYKSDPNSELAIGLTQAELELDQDQLEHATATLNNLRQLSPRHPRILKMLEKIYIRLGDWKNLELLLPSMQKAKLLTGEQKNLFEKNLYVEMLRASSNKNLEEIKQIWNNIPRAARKNPEVVYEYVKQLKRFEPIIDAELTNEIEELIRKTLKYHFHPELVKIYGTIAFANVNRQLVVAGAWLKTYGSHPELYLTLGRLCSKIQLWGKAKDYFEKCIDLKPNAEASLEYGKLLEKLGESHEALEKYKEGLAQLTVITNQ